MLSFILASGNKHKAEELDTLLKEVTTINSAQKSLDVNEDGVTFLENALIKAKAYYDQYKAPVVSDDSGLVLEFYPDKLGVQTARYRPDLSDYRDKCECLLREIEGVSEEQRKAYFVCVLCFYLSPEEIYFFEGRVHGTIALSYQGEHGFGYDPIFVPDRSENDGKTLAQLPEWKMIHSHRAKAVHAAKQFLKIITVRRNTL